VVTGIKSGSPADNGMLQTGDVILEMNRKPVKNVEDARKILEKASKEDSLLLLVQRGGNTLYVVIKS